MSAGKNTFNQIYGIEGSRKNITVTPNGLIAQAIKGPLRKSIISKWAHSNKTIHTTKKPTSPKRFVGWVLVTFTVAICITITSSCPGDFLLESNHYAIDIILIFFG